MKIPVAIMSFNRPDYLEKVLASIITQKRVDLSNYAFYLFQDGAKNLVSGKEYASEHELSECVRIFNKYLPNQFVYASPNNLGVALNYDRAERFFFEVLAADYALFFEDDLVLSENYFWTLEILQKKFESDKRVGYLAAYGNHLNDPNVQQTNSRSLILMEHNWGFLLYKRCWLEMRVKVARYLDLVRNVDYRDKSKDAITSLLKEWNFGCPAISQDAIKTIACATSGITKVNTLACFAQYIGEKGLHMNSEIFSERKYDQTKLFDGVIDQFNDLEDSQYQKFLNTTLDWAGFAGKKTSLFERKGESGVDTISLNTAASENSTKVSVTASLPETIKILDEGASQLGALESEAILSVIYNAVLGRDPDASGKATYIELFKSNKRNTAVYYAIRGLINSAEFKRRVGALAPQKQS